MDSSSSEIPTSLPKDFSEARLREEIQGVTRDKGKFKEILAQLKNASKEDIANINEYANKNQSMRRMALTMQSEMRQGQAIASSLSSNEREKIKNQYYQEQHAMKMAQAAADGDIQGIGINEKGKCCGLLINHKDLDKDDPVDGKWALSILTIKKEIFILILGSKCFTGRNKLISKLIDDNAYGYAKLIYVVDGKPTPITLKEWEAILKTATD